MLSSLAALAYGNPDLILKNFIVSGSQANLKVDGYSKDVVYTYDTMLPTYGGGSYSYTDSWVALVEKGFLAAANDSNYSISGGPKRSGYNVLNFCDSAFSSLAPKVDYVLVKDAATKIEKEGYVGTLGYNFHAYAVLDYDSTTNKYYLYNPYGSSTDYLPSYTLNTGMGVVASAQSQVQTLGDSSRITTTSKVDYVTGSRFNDVINAFAGDDWIDGNGGFDYLIGGQGKDKFDLRDYDQAQGRDVAVIQDFWSIKDQIILDKGQSYTLSSVTTFENQTTRSLYAGNDLVAHIQGISSDLAGLSLGSSAFAFM
jgi:Ca2+-binding RTX toxin-like protein